jgi:sulfur-carrier protein adenylyltransferase/sulfurtransferase
MKLNQLEQERYSRHLLLNEVGEAGQLNLKAARVLMIGAGGLGCPALQYLAAAGVGSIGIVDFDQVDRSNLQRQILYTTTDIGVNKALAAKERLQSMNPQVNIEAYPFRLTASNALELIEQYDIVVDGTDNFSTRYLVNDACVICDKPLVYGSIYKFEGQVAVFNHNNGPSYRCLFPEAPAAGTMPSCSEIGVLGVLPGMIGCMQANEVLKLILEIGEPLSGRLLVYDALKASSVVLNVNINPQIIEATKAKAATFSQKQEKDSCMIKETLKEMTAEELASNMKDYIFVDVREAHEMPKIEALNALNFPLSSLANSVDEIPKDKPVVVFCQKGIRSRHAIEFLQDKYGFNNLINLKYGILSWS